MKSDIKEIVIGAGMLGRTLVRTLKAQGRTVTLLNRHGGTIATPRPPPVTCPTGCLDGPID